MRVTILCDASYCSEIKGGGYGYWIASARGREGRGGTFKSTVLSSNEAEMAAAVNALAWGLKSGLIQAGDTVLVQTDSQAAIDGFRHARELPPGERAKGDCLEALAFVHELAIEFRHVKGHTSRKEARYAANRMCDKRAKEGLKKAREIFYGRIES